MDGSNVGCQIRDLHPSLLASRPSSSSFLQFLSPPLIKTRDPWPSVTKYYHFFPPMLVIKYKPLPGILMPYVIASIFFFQPSTDHPDMVLPRHRFLFTSRTPEDRLSSSYDIMATWLRSVNEAIQVLHHHTTSLREAAQRFFPQPHEADSDSDSTYTFVSSDTDAVLSLAPTVTTEASTNSSSPSTTGSSSTMKGGEDASTISYDNDTLSLNSLLSIDSSSSDVKPTSVASDDPDFSDSTSPVRDSPPIQFPNSASLRRPLSSSIAYSSEDVEVSSVASNESSSCSS
jgi:hypothetical protein